MFFFNKNKNYIDLKESLLTQIRHHRDIVDNKSLKQNEGFVRNVTLIVRISTKESGNTSIFVVILLNTISQFYA